MPEAGPAVYNAEFFELGRLKGVLPAPTGLPKTRLTGVEARVVDLPKPFHVFYCYAPAQNGTAFVEVVLPSLTGHSYAFRPATR